VHHVQRLVWKNKLSVSEAILFPKCELLLYLLIAWYWPLLESGDKAATWHETNWPLQKSDWLFGNREDRKVIRSRRPFDHVEPLLSIPGKAFEPSVDLIIDLEYGAVSPPGDARLSDLSSLLRDLAALGKGEVIIIDGALIKDIELRSEHIQLPIT
jgi:hypothetical protein